MNIFTLALYKPTDLEQWICAKYQNAGIHYASDISIDRIADIFGVEVHTYEGPSFAEWLDGEYSFMFLNAYLTEERRRHVFFHELCHPLRHVGRQDSKDMPKLFKELQETQAALFQMYAAMPYYMLQEYEQFAHQSAFIKILAESFILPESFVQQRIGQMMRRMVQEHRQRNARARRRRTVHTEVSPELKRILEKLERQLSRRRGAAGHE